MGDEGGDAVTSASVRSAVGAVATRIDLLQEEVFCAAARRQPLLADLPAEVDADVRASVRSLLRAGLEMLASGEPFTGLGPEVAANALRRQAQGVPMALSLALVDATMRQVVSLVVAELATGNPGEPAAEDLAYIDRRMLELVRIMSWHSVTVLGDGPSTAPRSPAAGRAERSAELMALLLAGEDPPAVGVEVARVEVARVERLAAALGVRLPIDTVLALPGDADPEELGRLPEVLVARRDHQVILMAAGPVGRLPGPAAPRGMARVRDGDLVTATRRACRALAVVEALRRRAGDAGQIEELDGDEALPLAAVLELDGQEAQDAVRACFGELVESDRGAELLDTVSAALTWPQAASAARALGIHRHTFEYRLQRFTEITGQDLGDPVVRLRCQLALIMLRRWPYREPG